MGQLRKYRSNDETTGAEGNSSPDLNVIWTFKRVPVVFFSGDEFRGSIFGNV
jgi:hypothetical protein